MDASHRWAFWMQVPPLALSFALILWKVHPPRTKPDESAWQQISRIDWLGFVILTTSVCYLDPVRNAKTSADNHFAGFLLPLHSQSPGSKSSIDAAIRYLRP